MGATDCKHHGRDGSIVEDLTGCVIPAGHSYYDIILGMNKQSNEEGVA